MDISEGMQRWVQMHQLLDGAQPGAPADGSQAPARPAPTIHPKTLPPPAWPPRRGEAPPLPVVSYHRQGRHAGATVGACQVCQGTAWVFEVETREVRPGLESVQHEVARACGCSALRHHAAAYAAAQVPGRMAGTTLDSYHVEANTAAPDGRRRTVGLLRDFLRALVVGAQPDGVLLLAPPGRGKSHLLAALALEATQGPAAAALARLRPRGYAEGAAPVAGQSPLVLYVSAASWADDVSVAMAEGGGALALLKTRAVEAPLLLVDELGDGEPGYMGPRTLGEVLRQRFDAGLPFVAASNYGPFGAGGGDLGERLPSHLSDRLKTLPTGVITGRNWRTGGTA